MKTYADLDLKKIRDACGLDFARHTYSKGQCSCCYGPLDMSAEYWAKGKKPKKINKRYDEKGKLRSWQWDRDTKDITYILFKNAENGSGRIKSMDQPVKDYTCIEYNFKDKEQQDKVIQMLQEQLGDEYEVKTPKSKYECIEILRREEGLVLERINHFDAVTVIKQHGFTDLTPDTSCDTAKIFEKDGKRYCFCGWNWLEEGEDREVKMVQLK